MADPDTSPGPESALYVYGVVPSSAAWPADVAGVAASGVESVADGDLAALVSRVPLDEFGPDALKRNLESLPWLERTAFAHNAVLSRALGAEALVPFRMCTIFADEARVRAMLGAERGPLRHALARLTRRTEWSIKLMIDTTALAEAARRSSRSPAAVGASGATDTTPGHAFFVRRKLNETAREQARGVARAAAAQIDQRLRSQSVAATLLPPLRQELSGEAGEPALNAAYLVDRATERDFATLARDLAQQHEDLGIRLTVTGPWAPYNFVANPEEPK